MSVRVTPVGTAPTAPIVSTAIPAPARLASAASTVRSTPTTAPTGSSPSQNTVCTYLTAQKLTQSKTHHVLTFLLSCVPSAHASMVAPAWMELMRSPAFVYLDSLAATANMISMSVTPNHASMEALVLTVMGRTSAPVFMATPESIVR